MDCPDLPAIQQGNELIWSWALQGVEDFVDVYVPGSASRGGLLRAVGCKIKGNS
ncbi:MAG: hypothetical protein ACLGQX_09285 [Acidobacteriota bacterium]